MTQEEKELLLKDLCARLPFGVILDNPNPCGEHWDELISIDIPQGTVTLLYDGRTYKVEKIKPYLRPMSSMTYDESGYYNIHIEELSLRPNAINAGELITWLIENHFDYNNLIPRGLAIEAPEGMYKAKGEIA